MSIYSITLINFQSHRHSVIVLDEFITALLGESDKGKSSFIRALRWVAENRPSGDSYRSNFTEEDTVVVVRLTSGAWVERRKGKSVNTYTVCKKKGEEVLVFKAMGQGVPDEVLDLLKLRPINFQYQMDAPFLLSKGSSEVAQFLNKEARLDIIDRVSSAVRSKILKNNQGLDLAKKQVSMFKEQATQFANIAELDFRLSIAEKQQTELQRIRKDYSSISLIIEEISIASSVVDKWDRKIQNADPILQRCIGIEHDIGKARSQWRTVASIVKDIESSQQKLNQLHRESSVLRNLPALQQKMKQLQDIENKERVLQSLITNIQQAEDRLLTSREEEENAREAYKKATPAICPTCKGPWGKGHSHRA